MSLPARARSRLLPPMWSVKILAHDVPPRWHVQAQAVTLSAPNADFASDRAVKWVHSDAGVPPMRRFVRHSLGFATAKRVGEPRRAQLVQPRTSGPAQPELTGLAA